MTIKTVSFYHIEEVQKTLDRLVKKAEKHGIEFSYKVSGNPYYKTVYVYNTDGHTVDNKPVSEYKVEVIDIELTDTIICYNGWTVAAHIEHLDGGNIITPIGHSEAIPKEWYNISGNCDHCNSNRHRTKTYIVERNGEYKQVGSGCLKEYTGIYPELAIKWAQIHDMVIENVMGDESLYDMFGGNLPKAYDVIKVVALAIDSIKEFGYCKSDAIPSTKNRILKMFDSDMVPTSEVLNKANIFCEYVKNYKGTEDIILNVKAIALSGYCKYKHFGRLAYLPVVVERELERIKQAEERAIEAAKSNYIGEIGERLKISLSNAKLISSYENQYGYTYIYRFVDTEGNILTWFASKSIETDTIKTVTGTIKNHKEYNSEKQTILTRCKVA